MTGVSPLKFDYEAATSEQRAIIETDERFAVVLASAGSGKTWTVVMRYLKHVLNDGIDPGEVLCVTYTKRAASEMRSRIIQAFEELGRADLAQQAEHAVIGTVHSLCDRILREHAIDAKLDPYFEILGDEEVRHMLEASIQDAVQQSHRKPEVRAFLDAFVGNQAFGLTGPYALAMDLVKKVVDFLRSLPPSRLDQPLFGSEMSLMQAYSSPKSLQTMAEALATHLKLNLKPNEQLVTKGSLEITCGCVQLALLAWNSLENRLSQLQALDYSLLERRAIELLTSNEEVRKKIQRKSRVLIVDESQDLNPLQLELLQSIESDWNLFVGDDKQSIYGFRQAAPHLFRAMTRQYTCFELNRNWRSVPGVLQAVDLVFTKLWQGYTPMSPMEEFDLDNPVLPHQSVQDAVQFIGKVNEHAGLETGSEAEAVANRVQQLISDGLEPSGIAILVQTWSFGGEIQASLQDKGLQSRMLEGTGLLPRLETRDLANALTCLMKPADDFALLATLRGPLTELSLDSIVQIAKLANPYQDLTHCKLENQADQEKLQDFLKWWVPLSKVAHRLNAFEVIDRLIQDGGFLAKLAKHSRREEAIANVRKLLAMAALRPEADCYEFAHFLRSRQKLKIGFKDADVADENSPCITIATVHQAKGLEWNHVVVTHTAKPHSEWVKDLLIEKELPFLLVKPHSAGAGRLYEELTKRVQQKALAEGQRNLYVAMTRAAKGLDLYAPAQAKAGSFSEWLKVLKTVL